MYLTKNQVKTIERDLSKRGIEYPPLREDLLDHICTEVEKRMDNGTHFKEAHAETLDLFFPEEFTQIQKRTMKNLPSTSLLRNYSRAAYRNLLRHKSHTFINIFGLSISLALCILIFVFVRYELSYDQENTRENVYRLVTNTKQEDGQISKTAFTGAPWGPALVKDLPEFSSTGRIMKYRLDVLVSYNKKNTNFYESDLIWGDPELLKFFDIELIAGDDRNALREPNTVVVSEATAKKYFGNEEAIGQVLTYNNEVDLKVVGIMKDMPENIHFKADFICSFSTLKNFWGIIDSWTILYYHTYMEIQSGFEIADLELKLSSFFTRKLGEKWSDNRSVELQNVKDIHLTSGIGNQLKAGTNIEYLYLLGGITLLILFLACANFINLNIVRSLKRTKEIGIRKVMGSLKGDIIYQFVLESALLTFSSIVLSLLFSQLLLPFFNRLLGKELSIFQNIDSYLVIYVLLIGLIISVAAGFYPAVKSARVGTILALKGKTTAKFGKAIFGDGLMLFQFAICTMLLIAIGVIKLQQNFIYSKDLGYTKEQILVLSTNNMETNELPIVKQQLLSIPSIQHVSITSHKLVGDQPYYGSYIFSGSDRKTDTLGLGRLHIDEGFIQTYGVELLAGRDYNSKISTDTTSFLINEKTAEMLGLLPEEAIDLTINYRTQGANGRYERTGRVIGVIRNFHFQSLHEEIEGLVMDIQPPRAHFIACKLINQVRSDQVIAEVENEISSLIPNAHLDYFFMNDQYKELYAGEKKMDILISIASGVAVIIAFMGLLGLVSQVTAYRKREVGLRKVLGANTLGIVLLFSNRYFKIILSSLLIAFPLSYYSMSKWLENYPYRVGFPIILMVITGLALIAVALLTIWLSTRRTANMNPAVVLKED